MSDVVHRSITVSGRHVEFVHSDEDLWFSQRSLGRLIDTTPQNVTIHLRELKQAGMNVPARSISLNRPEGSRSVRRRTLHFNLETTIAIALRARRFDEHSALLRLAASCGVELQGIRITPVKERNFAEMLRAVFDGVTPIVPQRRVGRYRIDFYFPDLKLGVEFDEDHHNTPVRARMDAARHRRVVESHGIALLRVREGHELQGINQILKAMLRDCHSSGDLGGQAARN